MRAPSIDSERPTIEFFTEPARFLSVAQEHLAADPVLNTVISIVTERFAANDAAGVPRAEGAPCWWMVSRDHRGMITGVGMRTATAPPYALYLAKMPTEAAAELGRQLVARGESVERINGVIESALPCAAAIGELTGRTARVAEHSRLFECTDVVWPAMPPGRLRPAYAEEAELCLEWFQGFLAAARDQAGGKGAAVEVSRHTVEEMERRIADGSVWLWESAPAHGASAGEVVHLSAVSGPTFGVARIGPVYTPVEHRGRGYAAAAVALLTQRVLDSGARVCLFTDQANPVSNRIYQALGYRAVADTGEVALAEP